MCPRTLRLTLALLLAILPRAASAQDAGPVAGAAIFESWQPMAFSSPVGSRRNLTPPAGFSERVGRAVMGGAIGAVGGVVFCTIVSNLAKDEGTGFSTCTTKGYLLTGGVGFGLGFLVGWLAA